MLIGLKSIIAHRHFFANTLDEAKCLADKILSGYDYKRNDNYFEQEYYGKLRGKIEQELRI